MNYRRRYVTYGHRRTVTTFRGGGGGGCVFLPNICPCQRSKTCSAEGSRAYDREPPEKESFLLLLLGINSWLILLTSNKRKKPAQIPSDLPENYLFLPEYWRLENLGVGAGGGGLQPPSPPLTHNACGHNFLLNFTCRTCWQSL